MTSNGIELRHAAPQPGRVGQATAVEQSRAVAEVQAAIFVARQFPRNVPAAIDAMRESCKQMELASRAFYEYPRAGEAVSGASVHLARELARIWGNFQYGISELRRDDEAAQSEMLAFAWDVETNTRNSNTFINPHKRDTRQGVKVLTDMRDIYESNANQAARRVRETILASLPPWFVEEAKRLCSDTLEHGGGVPLATRIADAIKAFERIGVSQTRMEAKFERPAAEWRPADVARLGVIYESLKQNTVTVEEEFPDAPKGVSAADILGTSKPAEGYGSGSGNPAERPRRQQSGQAAPDDLRDERPEPSITSGQIGIIGSHGKRLGYEEHELEEFVACVGILAGAEGLTDISNLTQTQGQQVQERLKKCPDRPTLAAWTAPAQNTLPGGK